MYIHISAISDQPSPAPAIVCRSNLNGHLGPDTLIDLSQQISHPLDLTPRGEGVRGVCIYVCTHVHACIYVRTKVVKGTNNSNSNNQPVPPFSQPGRPFPNHPPIGPAQGSPSSPQPSPRPDCSTRIPCCLLLSFSSLHLIRISLCA